MTRERERSGGGGLSIAGRFSLFMTLALAVVMAAAGFFLLDKSRDALERAVRTALNESTRLMNENDLARGTEVEKLLDDLDDHLRAAESSIDVIAGSSDGEDVKSAKAHLQRARGVARSIGDPTTKIYEQKGGTGFQDTSMPGITRFQVTLTEGESAGEDATVIQYRGGGNLITLQSNPNERDDSLFGLILVVTAAVIAVGAGVAFIASTQVTKPIEQLVNDVRSISHGNLHHRTRVRGGGEVYHLARQIDRMAQSLEEAQDAEIELGVREREREVAAEVREALLPQKSPGVAGYEIVDLHVNAAEPGGDFHDFVEAEGRVVLLVCEVSGRGVPGALVGAMARAYLRTELERGGDLESALKKINRDIARDVRRGMYVTAMCVALDPQEHVATVACAGHKLPLVRFDAASGQVRLIQPEGIALGFDKGPIFDRGLELTRVPLEPGDRLVISNTGPVQVVNADGEELGEKAFYRIVARNAKDDPEVMMNGILTALETRADEEDFPADISLIILARKG